MLINEELANKTVATIYGKITFNDKGENNELKEDQQKALGKLIGFQYQAPKKPKTTEKKEEPKKEEPKKKATPKKTTTKKATTKKTETKDK